MDAPDRPLQLDVTILGREYRVACGAGEQEALLRAVAHLDARMREIRDTGKVAGMDRIAVMAALNIAHELLTMKFGGGFDIGEAKRRIAAVEAKLDSVLGKQEKLF